MNPGTMERLGALRQKVQGFGEIMVPMRGRFEALRTRHEDGTAPRAVSSFNLFQTPPAIAARMVQIARQSIPDAGRILEPSAGLGRIYREIISEFESARVVMVEESDECRMELTRCAAQREGDRIHGADFLSMTADELGGTFDLIIMNPPFKQGSDIKHIFHAFEMLRPGGLLVSLCYAGARQSTFLRPRVDSWEDLPVGTFKDEGTGANVAMITKWRN